jgi:hypothetical protein
MITKFKKYNESIRDMMTPKSREEIIKNLKGRKDIIFKRTHNPRFTNATGEIGRMSASYDDLVELFGEPDESPDEYKISTEWCLVDSLGRYCSLFDWKQTNLYDPDFPSIEEFRSLPTYDWIISADINQKDIMEDLKTYIMLNIT